MKASENERRGDLLTRSRSALFDVYAFSLGVGPQIARAAHDIAR